MLFEVMKHIRNFFPAEEGKLSEYVIEDGAVVGLQLLQGQYFLIEGSILNDGVYQFPVSDLKDETFKGIITPLAIPQSFIDLVEEISLYAASNQPSAFTSESFGGYSYTRVTGRNGNVLGWADVFATRLNAWRKI